MSSTTDTLPAPAPPRCGLCAAHDWTPRLGATRLRRCRACGAILNDRSASREEEERRYDRHIETVSGTAEWDLAVRIARTQWSWVQGLLGDAERQPNASILDIGCGQGAFLAVAGEHGFRAAGVEIDPAAVEIAHSRKLDVFGGSIFDTGVPGGPFQLVTFWDVLEHLEEPTTALKMAVGEMAPGGLMVVRGRNADVHAPAKVAYARVRGLASALRVPDMSCVHRWGFGPRQYRKLLQDAGLNEIRLYAGMPTPGDRTNHLGPAWLAGVVKGAVGGAARGVSALTGGALYPFPSVLITARRTAR